MKQILLLSIFLLINSVEIKAQQWFKYADFPVNIIPKDIASNNAGTMFLLTTENSLFYKTLGGNWTKMDTSAAFNINCISADINNNKIYVGTLNGGLFHTSNFGVNWGNTFLFTNPHTGMHEGYNLISNIRNSNLFFATNVSSNQVARFTSNGNSGQMRVVSEDIGFGILAIHQTQNETTLIGSNEGLWISTDNGNSFIPFGLQHKSLFKFTEDENGRVYTLLINASGDYELWRSDPSNFNTWTEINLPNTSEEFITAYYDRSSSKLWLASKNAIYSASIENFNWENSSHNLNNPKLVEFIDDNNGNFYSFTVNENCLEHESGSWEDSNNGLSGDIHQIGFGNDDKIFAINNYYSNKLSSMLSASGQWINQQIGDLSTGLRSFIKYDNNVLITSVWNEIYISLDNGSTFSLMNLPDEITNQTAGGIDIIRKGEQNSLIISHTFIQKKIFISHDLGQSWSVVDNLLEHPLDFTQDSNGNLFTVLWGLETGFVPELFYSNDDGGSWNQISEQVFTFSSNDPELISKDDKTYLEADGQIFLINSEFSLEEINLPFTTLPTLDLQFAVNNSNEFFITDSNSNLYKSTDNGVNWTNLEKPAEISNAWISSIDFGFNDIPFVIYRQINSFNPNQGIYYFRDEEIMNINENLFENHSIIYPNPTSDYLFIETKFRGNAQLTDFTGKTIFRATIKQHQTNFNLIGLNPGIYILKFENGKSHKIIKK